MKHPLRSAKDFPLRLPYQHHLAGHLRGAIPRRGLVAEYLLNGDVLDTNDGTKHHGTATNVSFADTPTGYQRQCGVFGGSNSKVNCGTEVVHGNSFTVVAFYKRGATSGEDMIFTKWAASNDRYGVGFIGGGTNLVMNIGTDGTWRTVAASTDTNWHMVTLAFTRGRAYGYFDNNSATVDIATTYSENNAVAFTIGDFAPGTGAFNGNIQEVRVYGTILTDAERLALWYYFIHTFH